MRDVGMTNELVPHFTSSVSAGTHGGDSAAGACSGCHGKIATSGPGHKRADCDIIIMCSDLRGLCYEQSIKKYASRVTDTTQNLFYN